MILVTTLAGKTYYGRKAGWDPIRGLVVADWCADPDFRGPVHQEGIPEANVRQVAAAAKIPETMVADVEKRIERINRQAKKVGAPLVELQIVGEELRPTKQKLVEGEWVPTEITRFLSVTVTGSQPILPGGWRLAAVVDYRQAVPLVSMVPGETLPLDPRGYGARCDHCGTSRQRADVFVLVNDAGEGRQVGRNCLGDFLGLATNDPALALMKFGTLGTLLDYDEDEKMGGGGFPSGFYLDQILVLTAAILNVSGWVSRSRSETEGIPSTSGRIHDFLFPPSFQFDGKRAMEYRAWRADVKEHLASEEKREALRLEAEAAKTWAQTKTQTEFELELADISRCPFLAFRYLGRAAYILAGFRKEQDRLKEAERRGARWAHSTHIGVVGVRSEFEFELVEVRKIEGDFGTTTLATFDDGNGNQVKWFASNFPEWLLGEKRRVKATVKKHDAFRGTAQTVVTRVS